MDLSKTIGTRKNLFGRSQIILDPYEDKAWVLSIFTKLFYRSSNVQKKEKTNPEYAKIG